MAVPCLLTMAITPTSPLRAAWSMHNGRWLAKLICTKQALWQLFGAPPPWWVGLPIVPLLPGLVPTLGPLVALIAFAPLLGPLGALTLAPIAIAGALRPPMGKFRETTLPTKLLLTRGPLLSRPVTLP